MNIKEARQEIIHTVLAYLKKDETGAYRIPTEKQRPILLMGPPGIGKTAILEQAASICGINLVAYTITHHTRQSAIGLPFISTRSYDGKEVSITEYTMSEVIASIHDRIAQTGIREGILFLDEINCVSETLAPTMLQFLQYKTFGSHRLPEGFVIVTAGNPPEYNKSVRDFDIVTLDRVKRIDISEDYGVWKEYALRAGVHGAVMAYLEIRKDHFYRIRLELSGKRFVTARGWEDLSRMLAVYEELEIPVTQEMIGEYLQDAEIAASFSAYYDLYRKYQGIYRVPDLLEGRYPADTRAMQEAPFDEKLSLIGLLTDRLNGEFRSWNRNLAVQERLLEILGGLRETVDIRAGLADCVGAWRRRYETKKAAHLLDREAEDICRRVILALESLGKELSLLAADGNQVDFSTLQTWFAGREDQRAQEEEACGRHLTNSLLFLAQTYGESQEMALFLSELAAGYYGLKYVSECGNAAYDKYQDLLLPKDRRQKLSQSLRAGLKGL